MRRNYRFSLKHFLLIFFLAITTFSFAAPHWGGEISWEVLQNGKYRFILKYYRNCKAGAPLPDTLSIFSNSPVPVIKLKMLTGYPIEVTPLCASGSSLTHISCTTSAVGDANGSAMECIYTSDYYFPNGVMLHAVPPATGWEFYFLNGAARPTSVNLNNSFYGIYIRTKMFPYGNQYVHPGFDDSPTFKSNPYIFINAGYEFTYNPEVYDNELDSIAFSWGEIKGYNGTNAIFNSGYSYLNPLPGIAQNVNNIPATMNPNTGEIHFKSYTSGVFFANQKATAYKCGIKVSETYRDMVFYVLDDTINNPPNLYISTSISDTFYAGENIHVDFNVSEFQLQMNGDTQNVSYEYFGKALGAYIPATGSSQPTNSTTTGCINPPCAALTPASTSLHPISSQQSLNYSLNWQTDCGHLHTNCSCGSTTDSYDFIFKITNNYCPIPGYTYKKYNIKLIRMPIILPPEINKLSYDSNGLVISWNPVIDSLNIFKYYQIYKKNKTTGVFDLLDTTSSSSYPSIIQNNNLQSEQFYILPVGKGCNNWDSIIPKIDTLSSIIMTLSNPINNSIQLNWNSILLNKSLEPNQYYKIYSRTISTPWQLIDSTQNLNYSGFINACNDTVYYRVGINLITKNGKSSLESFSNIKYCFWTDIYAPQVISMHSVEIDSLTGNATVIWQESPDNDFAKYVLYKMNYWAIYTPIDTIYNQIDTVYIDYSSTLTNTAAVNYYRISTGDICENHSSLSMPLSINSNSKDFKISVFPNPANDFIKINIESENRFLGDLKIYSSDGKLMQQANLNDNQTKINISNLPSGFYFIEIQNDNQIIFKNYFVKLSS